MGCGMLILKKIPNAAKFKSKGLRNYHQLFGLLEGHQATGRIDEPGNLDYRIIMVRNSGQYASAGLSQKRSSAEESQ